MGEKVVEWHVVVKRIWEEGFSLMGDENRGSVGVWLW